MEEGEEQGIDRTKGELPQCRGMLQGEGKGLFSEVKQELECASIG